MTKKEILWREILDQAIDKHQYDFTQQKLAQQFGFSLSTVFNALKVPRSQGAITVSGRKFTIVDSEKFLYIWSTARNLTKEVIYQTRLGKTAQEIEGMMPPEVIFAAFSAYVYQYKEAPADYDKIYLYVSEKSIENIKKRFPPQKGYSNIIFLKADPWLEKYGQITPDVQTFADLWNLKEWYAKEFLNALKEKMFD